MWAFVLTQLELLLRLVVAGVCGCLIGFERKNRLKEAGIRTHMIVAVGAALIMIISKYGFADVLLGNNVGLDPSRIAAQIVTGIGFLGAGMIFLRKQAISGLTTAAGIWATAGIGMAIGAQLYIIGIAATVFVFFVQVVLFKHYGWFHVPVTEQLDIVFSESADAIVYIQEKFAESSIEIINLKAERLEDGYLEVELHVKLPKNYDASELMSLFKDNPHVRSIEY
jgi:putative Mg2+ transporter-C (MgtC) family protein